MKPPLLPKKDLFCDLHLNSEGVDYYFSPDNSEFEEMKAPVCKVKQVHGRDLLNVLPELSRELSGPRYLHYLYDGMLTSLTDLTLTVYSADCLPFLFFEPERRVIAAVHAGWKGTLLDICGATVHQMVKNYQCDPARIRVVCGPSIHVCCFEIREDVASLFHQNYQAWEDLIIKVEGKMKLDLHELNRRQLTRQGIRDSHLEISGICTCCHPRRFPSFRRDGAGPRRIITGIRLSDAH